MDNLRAPAFFTNNLGLQVDYARCAIRNIGKRSTLAF
jgi:hypothetical protein